MNTFIGIDPGKDGGIVVLDEDGLIVSMHKPPLVRSSKRKDEYDIASLVRLLREIGKVRLAVLEKAQPMPAKLGGGQANFGRGYSLGLYQGILAALGIPHRIVSPRTWQKVMFTDISTEDTKQASVIAASRLWPGENWRKSPKSRKADHGLTDAALIAMYGLRFF